VPAQPQIEPSLGERAGRVLVGLNVNGLMFNGGYTRDNMFELKLDYRAFLDAFVQDLLTRPDTDLLLVPHTYAAPGRVESDNEACRLLAASAPAQFASRIHRVTAEYDQHEIKGIIGQCDFFVGSRMHACIAALSQGIPTVGVAYSRKFAGVFDCVGAGGWVIDGRDTDAASALRRAAELYAERGSLRRELLPRVAQAREQLRTVFADLLAGA
jgi:colanic acid/amylovoran biosynthesis protein